MDTGHIIAATGCALGFLGTVAVFGMHLERRLTRIETMLEQLTKPKPGEVLHRWAGHATNRGQQ